jgi:mycothiol S-conjugate amidase
MPLPTEPLCLLTVHAHPDDEASKGASTVARYRDEGVHTILVCCTGGEEGDILNPAMERPEVRDRLPDVRREELEAATKIIGFDEVIMLGYRDSGMPETEANARPEAFANAPLDEAAGRLVAIIRRARPQVMITYGDDQRGYPHPDHLKVHDISIVAFDRAGDPDWYPEHGEPYQPSKLYYSAWSMRRMKAVHEKMLEMGLESPFDDKWFDRPSQEDRITTQIDISSWSSVRRLALLAHATQVDPTSKFWFGLPDDVSDGLHTHEDYIRARSLVDADLPETDLFAGIR